MRAKSLPRTLPLLILFLFLASCSRLTYDAVVKDLESGPGAGHYIKGVPFFPQDEYMCGPSAMASVMGYWGDKAGMKEVAKEVYEEKLKGTLPVDLLIYAREKGFDAVYYRGSVEDLKEKLKGNTPLILFLNLGYDIYPVGHYIVAVGYDERLKVIVAHSGMKKDDIFTYGELERSWGKTGFSTLLVRPKETPR